MIVLVTGASGGIGAACAQRFLEAGHSVIAAARNEQALAELAARHPGKVHTLVVDVADKAAVHDALAKLPADYAAIDVLVNNAGLALGLEPAHRADLDEWERMVDVNIKGLMYVTRAVLPGMVERDRGLVVNLGSV
ncbi:MAG: SDR family NAD(P)-dependent oxidoreductase, partial [Herbaspirillum sp.]